MGASEHNRSVDERLPRTPIRWRWVISVGVGLLFVALSIQAWTRNFSVANVTDYLSYWAAGKLTLGGDPAAAYDVAKHRAVEFTITRLPGLLPFPYPPPFLLLVTPFSLLPYMWGCAAWLATTLALYLWAARRVMSAWDALAQPSVLINGLIGQNGFLTAAIFTVGTTMLRRHPFAAGAILGAFVIKPQLALLLPVAVLAGRFWPAIAGAFTSAAVLLGLALILLGPGAYEGFWNILPLYTEMMRQDKWPWNEFISVFAFLRYFGIDQTVALTAHAIVAAAAALLTWIAWSRDWKEQVPILAAATLLIPPYLLTYDALLMIIPMGFWLKDQPRGRLVALLWLLCFLPIAFYFNLYRGPNTVPLAAMVFLGVTLADRLRGKRLIPGHVDHAHLV